MILLKFVYQTGLDQEILLRMHLAASSHPMDIMMCNIVKETYINERYWTTYAKCNHTNVPLLKFMDTFHSILLPSALRADPTAEVNNIPEVK